MKISYQWLRDYVDHPLSVDELSDRLTMCGLEVDDVETIGETFEGVIVGHVLDRKQHPNADKLSVCTVDLGGEVPVSIVCGAPNVAAGQNVPVATVGTVLQLPSRENPAEKVAVKIKKSKLRGEVSMGMICSPAELGISDDHDGILVLDDAVTLGEPFAAYLQREGESTQDAVYDIALTPNRPDAICHVGVARDIAALTEQSLQIPDVKVPTERGAVTEDVAVEIRCPEACHRYAAILVRGVRIAPSPPALQRKLEAIGLRPRNNVVDITNFVMHEIGQPLHAFDFDTLAGGKIIVELTEKDEPFTTLDGEKRTMPAGTMMICDAERRVAIAGVMGGENSEVSDETTNVLIESAWFDPAHIRKTAKALGMQTDASYRFERHVDPTGQVWAATRAAELMVAYAGGEIVSGVVDAHPVPPKPRQVTLRPARVAHVLGVDIATPEIIRLLTAIGFAVTEADGLLQCEVPSFRPDVEREIDLIEEVARLYGYDQIPAPSGGRAAYKDAPHPEPNQVLRAKVRHWLAGAGFREIYTNSMLRKAQALQFNTPALTGAEDPASIVETLNPISQEMAALRPSMLPGMLRVMQHNQNHGQRGLSFMEWGTVFQRKHHPDAPISGYLEREKLLLGLSGVHRRATWDQSEHQADFFDLKGVVEALTDLLQLPYVQSQPHAEPTALMAYRLTLKASGQDLGMVAQLRESVAEEFDLKAPVFFAELDWDRIVALAGPRLRRAYQSIERFPVVERDLALVVDQGTPVGALLETIGQSAKKLLKDTYVFDIYEGEHIAEGQKSVAIALTFGADRTLVDREVDQVIARILGNLEKRHNATLRA